MIKFADEISRHCLCQNCRMFSMSMYSDPASHLFCDTCISEQSYKHNKFEIYCPDERKPVPFEELFEALDVVTVLRDQHVQCPNQPKCAMILPLEQLENHYIQCKEFTSVNCAKCRREVAATSWNKHKSECHPTCDTQCAPKEPQNRYNLQFTAVSPRGSPASTPKKTGAAKGARPESANVYPTDELQRIARGGTIRRDERAASLPPYPSDKPKSSRRCDPQTVPCTFCGRQVKNDNMQRHVQACFARPTVCPSCEKVIKATDMNAHITRCQREDEEIIKKQQQQQNTTNEKKKSEAASKGRGNNLPSPSSNAHAAYQGNKSSNAAGGRGLSSSKRIQAAREPQLSCGCYTDADAWLPYAVKGNWYAACVLTEEQFRGTGTDQGARWAYLASKLPSLKVDHLVCEFISEPYEPEPFDCLITALIARVCLPQELWPQGLQVTWDHILMYLPSVLKERLSEGAKRYLKKHPVFVNADVDLKVDEVALDAAEALTSDHEAPVTSQKPAAKEAEILSVKRVEVSSAMEGKDLETDVPLAHQQDEELVDRKKMKKKSVADCLHAATSKSRNSTVTEAATQTEILLEAECVKARDEKQGKVAVESTYEGSPGIGETESATASQERSAALYTTPPSQRAEPPASQLPEPGKLGDLGVAEVISRTTGACEEGAVKTHGEQEREPDVASSFQTSPRKASPIGLGLPENASSPQPQSSDSIDKPQSLHRPEPLPFGVPALFKTDNLSLTETVSNLRLFAEPSRILNVEGTSGGCKENTETFEDGFSNNATSLKRGNGAALKEPTCEPLASSKLEGLRGTETTSNVEGLSDGECSECSVGQQRKLGLADISGSALRKSEALGIGPSKNSTFLQRQNSVTLYKPSSSDLAAPTVSEVKVPSIFGDLSVLKTVSSTQGIFEGGYKQWHGEPKEVVVSASPFESTVVNIDTFGEALCVNASSRERNGALKGLCSLRHSESSTCASTGHRGGSDIDSRQTTEVQKPCQKSYAEAVKQPNMRPTRTKASETDSEAKQEIHSLKLTTSYLNEASPYKKAKVLLQEELEGCASREESRISPDIDSRKDYGSPSSLKSSKDVSQRELGEDANSDVLLHYSGTGRTNQETIWDKSNSQNEQNLEHRVYAHDRGSAVTGRSHGRSSYRDRTFRNSTRKQQHADIETEQQRSPVTSTGQPWCTSTDPVTSSTTGVYVVKSSGTPCGALNAGLKHSDSASRLRGNLLAEVSRPSFAQNVEQHIIEKAHNTSSCTKSQEQHGLGFENTPDGAQNPDRYNAATSETPEFVSATIATTPSKEAEASASAEDTTLTDNGSSYSTPVAAVSYVTSAQRNYAAAAGSRYQINIPSSQKLHASTPIPRPFSSPTGTGRLDSLNIQVQTACCSAKDGSRIREAGEDNYSTLDIPNNSFDDNVLERETEV